MHAHKVISINCSSIYTRTKSIVTNYLVVNSVLFAQTRKLEEFVDEIIEDIYEDFQALLEKDPASKNLDHFSLDASKSFLAVMYYRIANKLYYYPHLDEVLRQSIAKAISEDAKIITGVEIHPAATIGKRFIIDHGFGTVIGETCEIGDDCYILENVILGAKKIANNSQNKRHPTLKNNVQIGGFARVFGPVVIGNNVFIAPHSVVVSDIPDNSKVTIVNQLQVVNVNSPEKKTQFHAFVYEDDGIVCVFGENIPQETAVEIIRQDGTSLNIVNICKIFSSPCLLKVKIIPNKFVIHLVGEDFSRHKLLSNLKLQIKCGGFSTIILQCNVLEKILLFLKSKI